MQGSSKFKISLSVFLVILVASLTFVYVEFYGQEQLREETEEEVMGVNTDTGIPYIISLAPIVAEVGSLYEYPLTVVDRDTRQEDLVAEYIEGPGWLELEDMVLSGLVPQESEGTYKIVLKVSDGYNSSIQETYILVEEENE
jgi:hypothetical protein